MKTKLHLVTYLVVFLAIASVPVIMLAAGPEQNMEQMISAAKSKADHEALAAHYEAEAKQALDIAERHQRMEKNYRVLETGSKGPKFSIHCKNLAAKYRGAAEENRKLAELHHQMATQATE
jgi:hypothetical protein